MKTKKDIWRRMNLVNSGKRVTLGVKRKFDLPVCSICKKWFATKQELTQHIQKKYQRVSKNLCPHCYTDFNLKKSLNTHIEKEHFSVKDNIKKNLCTLCELKFETKRQYSLHVSNVHTNVKKKEPESDDSSEYDVLDNKGKDSEKFEATPKIPKSKSVATKDKANTEVNTHDGTFQKETLQSKKSSVSKGASTSNVSTPKATGKKSTKDDSTQQKHTKHICKKCQISFATSRILSKHVKIFMTSAESLLMKRMWISKQFMMTTRFLLQFINLELK